MTTATNEKPILFSGQMIRALRAGKKTVTRRIVKPQPRLESETLVWGKTIDTWTGWARGTEHVGEPHPDWLKECPYGVTGDHLWVRENFLYRNNRRSVIYQADFDSVEAAGVGAMYGGWKPSIHLPRKFCRLVLEVEDVRVERLQEITEEDAKAEGAPLEFRVEYPTTGNPSSIPNSHLGGFVNLWQRLNADRGFPWSSNPFVWRVQFKVVEGLA